MAGLRTLTEGLPDKINVIELGGVVQGSYKTFDQVESNQYLTGKAFLSRSAIPDIQKNTRIIGICGISDYSSSGNPLKGDASPQRAGWFFSDFYLCHHMFREVTPDQIWMTCVSPEDAIEKYGEYVHGNSREPGSQRVVLDATMLQDVADVSVFRPTILLDRVASTISEVCHKDDGRPVLILIFSHGKEGTFAFHMGLTEGNKPRLLTMKTFKRAIGSSAPKAGLCLVTTACYSGGYAINADLNITTLAAQAKWKESLSWPLSATIRERACGSPFVTALIDTLLKLTMEGFNTEEVDDYDKSPTYAGLVKLVRDAIQEKDPKMELTKKGAQISIHHPMFSSQDDQWEMEYSKRTGLSLSTFKDRWLQLKAAGERQEPPGGEYQFGPGERIFSYDMLLTEVKGHAEIYLASKPGRDEQAKNLALHGSIKRLLKDVERPTLMDLVHMRESLDYRMSQVMGAATAYKNFWELDMPDCEEVDVNAYSGPNVPRAFDLVCKYALFDEPVPIQGHSYAKGLKYIACCIAKAGWSQSEATARLDSLVKYKEAVVPASGIPKVYRMSRLVSTINKKLSKFEREIRQELKTISQRTKRRIRDMSPGKSEPPRRKGLPEEWIEDAATADMARLSLRGAGPSNPSPSPGGPSSPSSSRAGSGIISPGPSRGGGRGSVGPTTPSRDGGRGGGRGGAGPTTPSPSRGSGRGGPGLSNPSPNRGGGGGGPGPSNHNPARGGSDGFGSPTRGGAGGLSGGGAGSLGRGGRGIGRGGRGRGRGEPSSQ